MKKKIFIIALMVALFACLLAVSVSAADWTYKDEDSNTYLTLTINDETKIITEYEGRFPMWNEKGEPLTWYIIKTEGNVKTVKSFVSYDPVYTNHGGGYFRFIKEADFTLKDKYPVPTKENVVSMNMPNDKGITAFSNYSAVNFQAGVTYTPDKLEILFLRCPNTLTNTERLVQATKILEVEFDKKSTFTTLSHLAFHESKSLRKVNIPASVEVIASQSDDHGRAFCNCVSLEEVTFDEGSNLKMIQNAAFKGCTSLKEIQLPASMVTIENNTLSYAGGFEIIRLPETFTHFVNTNSDGSARNDHQSFTYLAGDVKEYYLPASFYATAPDTVYRVSYAFYGGTNVKFFYCGTEEQLLKAIANFKSSTSSTTDNNGNFTNATVASYADYLSNKEAYSNGDYIFYGYNFCDAFRGGKHTNTVEYGFAGEKYLSDYCAYTTCEDCGKQTTTVISGALFVNKGYAKALDGSSFTYGISINRDEIAKYEKFTGETVSYGIFAAKKDVSSDGALIGENNAPLDGVILADFTKNDYSLFDLRVNGISEENKATEIYCGAYAIIGNATIYLGEGVSNTAKLISSDLIKNIEN
jgi:hypothetical protein